VFNPIVPGEINRAPRSRKRNVKEATSITGAKVLTSPSASSELLLSGVDKQKGVLEWSLGNRRTWRLPVSSSWRSSCSRSAASTVSRTATASTAWSVESAGSAACWRRSCSWSWRFARSCSCVAIAHQAVRCL